MRATKAEGFRGHQDLKLGHSQAARCGRVLVTITAAGVTPLDHTILSGGYQRHRALACERLAAFVQSKGAFAEAKLTEACE
jgi:hypothetical protein